MQTLVFDGRMGASGDMLLGALIAVGADPAVLGPVEAALDVEYVVGDTEKNGIAAIDVSVTTAQHDHAEGHGPHRTLDEVVGLVDDMDLDATHRDTAVEIFRRLAEAEAAVHGTDVADTHFHEVGADDAIADVVGTVLLLEDLDVEQLLTTPVAAGHGTVEMAHGTYPVPVPAVVELARDADWDLVGGPVDGELLTPTGAAILAVLADGTPFVPAIDVHASGYGAGTRDVPGHPNVLRAIVGASGRNLRVEDVTVLETNLDDATPEILGGLPETLADVGALDVSFVPMTMKKSRPGVLVTVVTKPEDAARVASALAAETGTLGVRATGATHRFAADRSFETVTIDVDGTPYDVTVKLGFDADGTRFDVSAEYDECAAIARETGRPVREIIRRAETVAYDED